MRHSFNFDVPIFLSDRKVSLTETFLILLQIVFFSENSVRVLLLISVENHSH